MVMLKEITVVMLEGSQFIGPVDGDAGGDRCWTGKARLEEH